MEKHGDIRKPLQKDGNREVHPNKTKQQEMFSKRQNSSITLAFRTTYAPFQAPRHTLQNENIILRKRWYRT